MYAKEDADAHQKVMKSFKKSRTWAEFRKLQQDIRNLRIKDIEQSSCNTQSSWESVFMNLLNMHQFQLILIVNHGTTKRLKNESKQALDRLSKIINELNTERDNLHNVGRPFSLALSQQRYWLGRLKSIFKK